MLHTLKSMHVLEYWYQIENVCLHPELRSDSTAMKQARIMLAFCLLAGLSCLGTIVVGVWVEPHYLEYYVYVALGHVLTCSSFVLLRFYSTMRVPSTVMMVMVIAQLTQGPIWTGFVESPILYTYPLATIFMGVIGGRRNALITGVTLSVMALGIWQMGVYVPDLGTDVPLPFISTMVLIWCTLTAAALAVYNEVRESGLRTRLERELLSRTKAQEEAEQAVVAKDLFLAYLSHEIRNPLTVIVAGVEMMEKEAQGLDASRVDKYVESLKVASFGLGRLLDDVFDFTSIEQSRLDLQPEVFNLSELVYEVHQESMGQANSRGIESSVEVSGVYWVRADRTRVKQILTNLLSNALKFTHHGSITLSLLQVESALDKVQLSVLDTGVGISNEHIESIFKPFVRERSVHAPGIGLGLAICKGLLQQMGSQIHVESNAGEGSRFWFFLPTLSISESVSEPAEHTKSIDLSGMSLLIVDDNREIGELLTEYCQTLGMQVTYMQNAGKGLEIARTYSPDIVLVDFEMPMMSGEEFVRSLQETGSESKLVLLTGSTLSHFSVSVDAIVQKPVAMTDLEQILSQFV